MPPMVSTSGATTLKREAALLSSGLTADAVYRRLRNFTESATKVARGLYRRWGIAPRPEDFFYPRGL